MRPQLSLLADMPWHRLSAAMGPHMPWPSRGRAAAGRGLGRAHLRSGAAGGDDRARRGSGERFGFTVLRVGKRVVAVLTAVSPYTRIN
jgi:hypothetical protein